MILIFLIEVDKRKKKENIFFKFSLAAQNLRMIYLHLNGRTNNSISSEMLQLPKDVEQFGEFLRQFNLKRFKLNLTENIILDTKNNYR